MWHGSASNTSAEVARTGARLAHAGRPDAVPRREPDLNYSRYRRRGDLSMDESFFPVMWDASGYRTPWLAELPDID